MSRQSRAQKMKVINAEATITTGVDELHLDTIANTGVKTNICIRYIP